MINLYSNKLRHPEKVGRPRVASMAKPPWIRVRSESPEIREKTHSLIRKYHLSTVCEEAQCPNLAECWRKRQATFLILGKVCTRGCGFCHVSTGRPDPVDPEEPQRLARAIEELGLQHAVITSVDRDDLEDGGASHFSAVVQAIRKRVPETTIELLTPDFLNKTGALDLLLSNPPDVFNHNIETVPRFYPKIRPGARYFQSLRLLQSVKEKMPSVYTKSGLMLGFGETREEIIQVLDDLRSADVDFVTMGQYLQPTPQHVPVARYIPPEEFQSYGKLARGKGFSLVSSSPLTRSSFHAEQDFLSLRQIHKR